MASWDFAAWRKPTRALVWARDGDGAGHPGDLLPNHRASPYGTDRRQSRPSGTTNASLGCRCPQGFFPAPGGTESHPDTALLHGLCLLTQARLAERLEPPPHHSLDDHTEGESTLWLQSLMRSGISSQNRQRFSIIPACTSPAPGVTYPPPLLPLPLTRGTASSSPGEMLMDKNSAQGKKRKGKKKSCFFQHLLPGHSRLLPCKTQHGKLNIKALCRSGHTR